MRNTLALTFLFLLAAIPGHAADDTYACLSQSGPDITISGDRGYNDYFNYNFSSHNVKIDARDALFKHQQVPDALNTYPVNLGMYIDGKGTNPVRNPCIVGGKILGTNPLDADYLYVYGREDGKNTRNSASVSVKGGINAVIEGWRIHNTFDAFRTHTDGPTNFRIKDVWVSYNRDDCVENDGGQAGVVEDSLFDGCFQGFSGTAGGSVSFSRQKVMTIKNSLVRLQPMPDDSCRNGNCSDPAHYGFFKWKEQSNPDGPGPMVEMHNNIFLATQISKQSASNQWWQMAVPPPGRSKSCSNNTLVWLGPGTYPGDIDKSCITVISGQEGQKLWDAAKQNWINCHPKVGRLPGDPQSNPSQCDPSAYGGGGTGTPSGGTTGPGPCHLLTSSQSVPQGFGAAFNLFSAAKELLLNVECGATSNATLTVGNNQNTTYIYRLGYEWLDGRWKQISFGGQKLVANDWYVGNASANLFRSQTQLAQDNFVVAYTCHWINNAWKCGCRDQSCTTNHWQLQAFRK